MVLREADDLRDDECPDDEECDDDSAALAHCPSCGETIYEDGQQCPYCKDWIVAGASGHGRWPRWMIVAIVMVLIASLLWWIF